MHDELAVDEVERVRLGALGKSEVVCICVGKQCVVSRVSCRVCVRACLCLGGVDHLIALVLGQVRHVVNGLGVVGY